MPTVGTVVFKAIVQSGDVGVSRMPTIGVTHVHEYLPFVDIVIRAVTFGAENLQSIEGMAAISLSESEPWLQRWQTRDAATFLTHDS